MAKIVGSIASSHTPTIGFAYDQHKQTDPAWAPIFEAYAPVARWLLDQRPDVVFYIFNDHVDVVLLRPLLGVCTRDREIVPAGRDEGGGPRALPPLIGHAALAAHIGNSLVAEEFDLSFFQDKPLDHGAFSPISRALAARGELAGTDRPVANRRHPIPDPVGQAMLQARAVRYGAQSRATPKICASSSSRPEACSHQVHGERAGFNNPAWDKRSWNCWKTIRARWPR